MTLWTVAYQVPPSMGFSRQEYWSGLLFPSPGDLPDQGNEPGSPALEADTLASEPPGKPSKCPPNRSMLLQMAKFCSFFFMIEKRLLCIYITPQLFFIHSSVDEDLGCFHMLTIVNNAAMNTELHISFQISVFGCLVIVVFFPIYTQEWNC